jgi:hypothetical protein|tara:strand:+ start:38 stop:253 length:216 start_codon:yes stop_codon:yes gene_type:complete
MNNDHDPDYFHRMSVSEYDRAEAELGGQDYPERAWLLSMRDVWYANPCYSGPPVRHPEAAIDDFRDDEELS